MMKIKKIVILFSFLASAIWLYLWMYMCGTFPTYDKGLYIDDNVSYFIKQNKLSKEDSSRLQQAFQELKTYQISVGGSQPTIVLSLYKQNQDKRFPRYISIWLDEGYVYDGFYLDAFHERMLGKCSVVFKIDAKTKRLLHKLIEK